MRGDLPIVLEWYCSQPVIAMYEDMRPVLRLRPTTARMEAPVSPPSYIYNNTNYREYCLPRWAGNQVTGITIAGNTAMFAALALTTP